MTTDEPLPLESALWSRFFRLVAIAVLLAGGIVIAIESSTNYQRIQDEFLSRAQAIFHTVRLFRQWNAENGGVFVPLRPGVSANPHLKDPDIHTVDGKQFTLRNPAIMTREVSDLALADPDSPVTFRVTSLKLKNPSNAPDDWERQALAAISNQTAREHFAVIVSGERQIYRYLAPLWHQYFVRRNHSACSFPAACAGQKQLADGYVHCPVVTRLVDGQATQSPDHAGQQAFIGCRTRISNPDPGGRAIACIHRNYQPSGHHRIHKPPLYA